MKAGEPEISGFEIEVREIEMRFEMPRVVLERFCEMVERLDAVLFVIEYAEIAVCVGDAFPACMALSYISTARLSPRSCRISASSNG